MPEWLVERGIGETRRALVDRDRIVEARILREGVVAAGTVLEARLKQAGRNGVAVAGGVEYLLPKGSDKATEGAAIRIEVTREALAGIEPWKRPLARLTAEETGPAAEPKSRDLGLLSPTDELAAYGWNEWVEEARSGIVDFAEGALRIAVTPAMTLIDIDGTLETRELALAGAEAAAGAVRRHGIGGSIGIDFPTLKDKAARLAVAEAFDRVLPQPFERTAINGFGFMQVVRPRTHASSFELAADRAPFEAMALLRRAAFEVGSIRLVAAPAVIGLFEARPDWIERLSRQVGGTVTLREAPGLAISGGYAEPA